MRRWNWDVALMDGVLLAQFVCKHYAFRRSLAYAKICCAPGFIFDLQDSIYKEKQVYPLISCWICHSETGAGAAIIFHGYVSRHCENTFKPLCKPSLQHLTYFTTTIVVARSEQMEDFAIYKPQLPDLCLEGEVWSDKSRYT